MLSELGECSRPELEGGECLGANRRAGASHCLLTPQLSTNMLSKKKIHSTVHNHPVTSYQKETTQPSTNMLSKIARIARAALHKLPRKSSLNVRSVCLVCPVCTGFPVCPDDHDDRDEHDYKDNHNHDNHDD